MTYNVFGWTLKVYSTQLNCRNSTLVTYLQSVWLVMHSLAQAELGLGSVLYVGRAATINYMGT